MNRLASCQNLGTSSVQLHKRKNGLFVPTRLQKKHLELLLSEFWTRGSEVQILSPRPISSITYVGNKTVDTHVRQPFCCRNNLMIINKLGTNAAAPSATNDFRNTIRNDPLRDQRGHRRFATQGHSLGRRSVFSAFREKALVRDLPLGVY
jgi:hypothetical protein